MTLSQSIHFTDSKDNLGLDPLNKLKYFQDNRSQKWTWLGTDLVLEFCNAREAFYISASPLRKEMTIKVLLVGLLRIMIQRHNYKVSRAQAFLTVRESDL